MIPYKIAVLVYVFNSRGEMLLLHRLKAPNQNLYSPIGGKLEQGIGESPYACALREIGEEIGVTLRVDEIRLVGMVSERGYDNGGAASGASHWLMFCFEVTRAVDFPGREMEEGRLEWVDFPGREMEEGRLEWVEVGAVEKLNIPQTDREVIWPLVKKYAKMLGNKEGETFSVHIDCTPAEGFAVTMEHPRG